MPRRQRTLFFSRPTLFCPNRRYRPPEWPDLTAAGRTQLKDSMRDVHLREVDLNLLSILYALWEERLDPWQI
jgi:hypothetical protein